MVYSNLWAIMLSRSRRTGRRLTEGRTKMRFRNWLTRFKTGRYGTDQLNRALNIATLALLVLSLFIGGSGVGSLIWLLALAGLVWSTVRTFSRDTARRQRENAAYLARTRKLREGFRGVRDRFAQRKEYRFFRCPSCRTWLRVPRGKGKLSITCRQYGERFTRST